MMPELLSQLKGTAAEDSALPFWSLKEWLMKKKMTSLEVFNRSQLLYYYSLSLLFFYPTFPRFFVLCAFICIIKDMTRLC